MIRQPTIHLPSRGGRQRTSQVTAFAERVRHRQRPGPNDEVENVHRSDGRRVRRPVVDPTTRHCDGCCCGAGMRVLSLQCFLPREQQPQMVQLTGHA